MTINLGWVKKWYYKDFVINMIENDCFEREGMAVTLDDKVIRPVYLDSATIRDLVFKKKAVSFHRRIEGFIDVKSFDNIAHYDLIIDLDIHVDADLKKQLEAVSVVAYELIEFLYSFGFKEENIGIKYSGNHGIHIRLPIYEFDGVFGKNSLIGFPDFPRAVLEFISEIIKQIKVSKTNKYVNYVEIDPQVASPRHMIRTVMSINEKLPGVSVPLSVDEITKLPSLYKKFKLPNALDLTEKDISNTWEAKYSELSEDLFRISVFYKLYNDAVNNYIRSELASISKYRKKFKIQVKEERELFPPCIKNILEGVDDGRKRSVFILINFFANIGWDWSRISEELFSWNERNKDPLRERYIEYQIEWHKERYQKGNRYLPPNCDNVIYYKDIGVCVADDFCPLVKNPLAYFYKKFKYAYRDKSKKKPEKVEEKEEEVPEDLI